MLVISCFDKIIFNSLPSEEKKGGEKKGKFPIKEWEKAKKRKKEEEKKGKFPVNEWEKAKKKKKKRFLIKDRKKTEEVCRKVFGPENI